jgi:hypothetical protein
MKEFDITGTQNSDPCPTPPKQKSGLKTHLNARNRAIDPKKPLRKAKYEIMARELAKGQSQVDAYKKAYPNAADLTARANAHEVIKREGIQARALFLLEQAGLTEGDLFVSLQECVRSSDERIKLDSTKHALGMIGYGKEQKEQSTSYNPVQINFIVRTQPIDNKEDTTSP